MKKDNNYSISKTLNLYFDLLSLNDGNDTNLRRDHEEHIKFHVEVGDYLSNVAIILDLLLQSDLVSPEKKDELIIKIKNDLLYVQKHYKLISK